MPAEKDNARCFYVNPRGHEHIAFMIVDRRFVRVDVASSGVATSTGIRVGDSEERVHRVYGSCVKVTPHTYVDNGHYLTVRSGDPRFGVRFETTDGKITMYYAGTFEAIQYVEGCEQAPVPGDRKDRHSRRGTAQHLRSRQAGCSRTQGAESHG